MVDPFRDPARPHMARGTHTVGGMVLVVTPHLPRERIGTQIVPKPRALRWVLRWVPRRWRPAWYRIGAAIEQEQFFRAGGKIFCTPAGYQILKKSFERRTS